ncbi:MAG: TIGR03960 family B12-binding radical SAM protein [bacterium]
MVSFRKLLNHVSVPGRYLPLELFSRNKDPRDAAVRIVLAFPDTYEVGMSHLGVSVLYGLLNDRPEVACDRAYAPWPDMEEELRKENLPLCSHENHKPLREFDIIGFSLTYELCYTNVLYMLDLADIPLFASERKEGDWPLILGGGPCVSNPEPVAPFFDAFLFGEGEEAVPEICNAYRSSREEGKTRESLLEELAAIEGVYVPGFFEPSYESDGKVKEVRPLRKGHEKVRRRIVADLENAYLPDRPLVPVLQPVHDRAMVEVARGCSRGCRFCHAGMIYRPYRERSAERVLEAARHCLAETGYEECSLLSLSVGDYSNVVPVVSRLIREHYGDRVSISLPSLRVQGLTDQVLRSIEKVRKTGFTIAPEAGTERLRRVINKAYTEDELLQTATRLFEHGWRNLKLYFMIGLPTEEDEDLEAIVRLGRKIGGIRGSQGKPRVTLSVSGFVPKPHTPFQWEAQASPQRLADSIDRIKKGFSGKGKSLKWQDPLVSEMEGALSRGDRRMSRAVYNAYKSGQRFDGWSEYFDREAWERAFQDAGLKVDFYTTRERDKAEVFPWEHLDSGVDKSWLWEERERAYQEKTTPDCREEGCVEPCGVCDHETIKPVVAEPARPEETQVPKEKHVPEQPDIYFTYRVRYARQGDMRYVGQLEIIRMWNRLVRRAGLPVRYSQGYHPLPRIQFSPPPPVGVASEAEYIDLELLSKMDETELGERLSKGTFPGIRVLEVREIPRKSSSITNAITGFDYRVSADGEEVFEPEDAERFIRSDSHIMHQKREKGDREIDLRSRVKYLDVVSGSELRMGIRQVEGPGVKPPEVLQEVFGLSMESVRDLDIVRTEAWLRQARPVRYPGKGERVRKARPSRKR